jgi:3-oxoadipate enol-lactonase
MLLGTTQGEVHYEVHGPEGRPAVVLTHGAGLHGRMFDPRIEALREHYRVVVWDMPGHGLSHHLSGPLELRQQADHVMAILDALGIDRAVLVGHSLGSWVSQHAALAYANRVRGVVSLGGTPLHRPPGKLFNLFFLLYCELFRLLPEPWIYRSAARMKAISAEAQAFYLESLHHIGREQNYLISKGMAQAGRCLALVLACARLTPSPGVGQESRARGRTGCPAR